MKINNLIEIYSKAMSDVNPANMIIPKPIAEQKDFAKDSLKLPSPLNSNLQQDSGGKKKPIKSMSLDPT